MRPQKTLTQLIAYTLLIFNSATAQVTPSPTAVDPDDIAKLRHIEQNVLPPMIVDGPPRHSNLVDYYCAANVELTRRLELAKRIFADKRQRPYRAMTLVAGPAGIGKTFIKRHVYSDVPADTIWKFDVRELFDELAHQGLAELKPDLQYGDLVFNRMLALKPEGRGAFVEILNSCAAAFVVVDSLDEIHPDDYVFVLEQLERFSLNSDRAFVQLVVFGRPLAFQGFWKARAANQLPEGLGWFLLNKPELRTTGDLTVSNWNYDCWKHKLRRGRQSQSRPMLFQDYRRWSANGYLVAGEFANVCFVANQQMTQPARDRLRQWSATSPVVASVLPNLAANGIVRDILVDHVQRGHGFVERRFMEEFLAKWLERDTRSDDRPSGLKPEYLDMYSQLLEGIAVKYLAEDKIDSRGFFRVSSGDRIVIQNSGELIAIPVQRVLNRSGLITVDAHAPTSPRFRFEPFWFHRLLVQMHSERLELDLLRVTSRLH